MTHTNLKREKLQIRLWGGCKQILNHWKLSSSKLISKTHTNAFKTTGSIKQKTKQNKTKTYTNVFSLLTMLF